MSATETGPEGASLCNTCGRQRLVNRESWIYIGELSKKCGVNHYKLRKWTREGRIPCHQGNHEYPLYPEHLALTAIRKILSDALEPSSATTPDKKAA